MKVLSKTKNNKYEEIVIQTSFLWIKFTRTYRMYKDKNIFLIKGDNHYIIGTFEYLDAKQLFSIEL